ncbi:hypothetical protein [Thalassotalea sp. Y01]|uniref:hypothetical protein n=1 Tax=Thalassotalea sp. Y01 TaxID=2729613 RepID=UPI00145E40EF|nr:hypothetical protein [Thalassotalea sp. Y01]NMP16140.1 hypothetical protein [Thalassotalea sp. Y01]
MKTLITAILVASLPLTSQASDDTQPNPMIDAFAKQHSELMPKVAVADMYYGCLLEKGEQMPSFTKLIKETDKETLANDLTACLGDKSLASDAALNYGIAACFYDQMAQLDEAQRQQNMQQVKAALADLPRQERQKSFTQCVNNQTLKYLSN